MGTYTKEFGSIGEFYKYLCDTPFNDAFRWANHRSVTTGEEFTGTKSFDEAVSLMRNGWSQMADKLNTKLAVKMKQAQPVARRKQQLGVAGYQPIVPLYLAGVPTNMMSQIQVKCKSKVVNITKSVSYNCKVTTDTIIEESVKTLQIVRQLEATGYRVNLNVAFGSEKYGTSLYAKVRIKSANEKLNISKVAFPLVHPSMLRRLMVRYVEVCPATTMDFVGGYGVPVSYDSMKKQYPGDIILPAIYSSDVNKIKSLEDLVAAV